MTQVSPLIQKLRKINEDCANMIQKHPEFSREEILGIKNSAAMQKWNLLKKEGLIVSNWRPF